MSLIWIYLELFYQIIQRTIFVVRLKLLFLLGSKDHIRKKALEVHKACHFDPDDAVSPEEHLYSFVTFAALFAMINMRIKRIIHRPVQECDAVHDVTIVKLNIDGGKSQSPRRYDATAKCRLLDFLKSGRPLVVNFGSCT